ncbi:MAG: methyltransferase domain-containing protein [Gammaproteobacteria bacterium]
MSLSDLRKWDDRYREGAYAERRHPSALVARFAGQLAPGRALDVACGAGRNTLYLAAAGFEVDAVDISEAGLERLRDAAGEVGRRIRTCAADLEHGVADSLSLRTDYDLIVVVRYVNLPLLASLADRLAPAGVLISEQHLKTDEDVIGPNSPAYRLAPSELLDTVRGLRVHYYREGIVTDPDGRRAALAQLVASHAEATLFID